MSKKLKIDGNEAMMRCIFEPKLFPRLDKWLDHYEDKHGYNEDDLSWDHYTRRLRLLLKLHGYMSELHFWHIRQPWYKPKRTKPQMERLIRRVQSGGKP